jgi:hypothetical protein
MKRGSPLLLAAAALGLAGATAPATELTFDICLDGSRTNFDGRALADYDETYRLRNFYGSRVSESAPEEVFAGHFRAAYGPAGGPTPGIEVEFRRLSRTAPTSADPAVNGDPNGSIWAKPWGESGMTNVLWNSGASNALMEIRFVPDAKRAVVIESFLYGAYGASAEGGDTLKIVEAPNSASPRTLWRAGGDGSVAATSPRTRYTPCVTGEVGKAVSLIFHGPTGSEAIDSIVFSEVDAKRLRR